VHSKIVEVMPVKVLVLGGTGFVGKNLCRELLSLGYQLVLPVRNEARARSAFGKEVELILWTGAGAELPADDRLKTAACIINLAGESIGEGRWTEKRKQRIIASRVDATGAIIRAIEKKILHPKLLINASAVGIYGPAGDESLTEDAPPGGDFLAHVCRAWENEAMKADSLGVRAVTVRIGVVLGNGGALNRMVLPFKLFLGGLIGSGQQWLSWIHLDDLIEIIKFIIKEETISGPVNGTAPNPVKMGQFAAALGKVLGKPSWLPVPEPMLRLAMGEMAQMVLTGQRVIPKKLLAAGYAFKYPNLENALREILPSKN
jgi:uncharacterized protein (TIGR01777 family)